MKKRLLSILCAVTLVFGTLVSPIGESGAFDGVSLVASAETFGDYEYTVLDDGTVEISKYKGTETEITIPSEIDGKIVTSIGEWSFFNCSDIMDITIPNCVADIKRDAFRDCIKITNITIPASVKNIGENVFEGCTGIVGINVDKNNAWYCSYDGVLFNKDKTTIVSYPAGADPVYTIPDGVTNIGVSAFEECSNLTDITIPNSVIYIEDAAFRSCDSLTSVTIPLGVERIGYNAFASCDNLEDVVIPESVNTIESNAFTSSLILNKQTTAEKYIGDWLVHCDDGEAVINIKDGTRKISDFAFCFAYEHTIEEVNVPSSVEKIGKGAFENSSIKVINVDEENNYYCSVDGALYNKEKTVLICCPPKKESIDIPKTVKSIEYRAFSLNDTAFSIPEGIERIEAEAFLFSKSGQDKVDLPESVKFIGKEAFWSCNDLTAMYIPKSVTTIEANAIGYNRGGAIEGFTIYGYKNTTAETYAKDNGFIFVALDDVSATLDFELKAPEGSALAAETATITIDGDSVESVDGSFTLPALEDGEYEMTISAPNFVTRTYTVTVKDGAIVEDIAPELNLIGDITGDGKLNTADLLRAKSHIKGASKLTGYELDCANIDGNDKVNAADLLKMKAHIKGVSKLWA